ncbi:T9SS type A sorting domain-containing protein [Hanstruepera flava]|uniref:T9SS type A sorting domain-containing protein n=1 Tax=Hanstruepera flava TaxID=2930218 RepID=UPI002028DCBF|nr:T9SS type A sorting domain-containing protein [Hanstruepera flava]
MKKKYTMKKFKSLVVACLMLGTLFSFAQVTSITSDEYGRIFDVVYDQNTENKLYAATLNNHILVSHDNGVTWELFYSVSLGQIAELQTLNNTHLSFYLRNTGYEDYNTVYLIDLNTLALTSIDRPVNGSAEVSWATGYSIYENDTDIMLYKQTYMIGFDSYDSVYYTTDGGTTWTLVYDEIVNNLISVDKVLISYDDPNLLFVTRGNGANGVNGGLLVSTDAGANWTEHYATINIRGIAVDPNNADHWMIGTDPGWGEQVAVYQTLDAGANWTELAIPFDDYSLQELNEVIFHPAIPNKIYLLETNEIAISSDGGANWSVQWFDVGLPETDYFYGLSATFNPNDNDEVIYTSNWYPFRSTDGGVTLSRMFSPYGFTSAVGLSPDNGSDDPYLYYGAKGGFIARNLNTSVETTYNVQQIDYVSNDGGSYFVDENQYGRVFSAVGGFSGNALSVSTDHGQSFHTFYNFFDPLVTLVPDPVNTNEVWVAFDSWGSAIAQIVDVTSTDPWAPTITYVTLPATGRINSMWINPSNNQEVLISQGGEIWSTTDRGTNWTNSSTGLTLDPTSGSIFDIVQSPNDPNEFTLATSNGVWKSTDHYANWVHVLNTNDASRVLYDPNHPEVMVATVYSTLDAQATIFHSEDYGTTWTMVPYQNIGYTQSYQMAIDFNGTGFKAFMSTPDLGIITYDVSYMTLSVDTPTLDTTELLIYPNPVKDVMNIALQPGIQAKSVVIYNMLGAQVKQANQASQIDISDLNSGIYLVKVTDSEGRDVVKRIIKR